MTGAKNRQLTDDEKRICAHSMDRISEEIEDCKTLLEDATLKHDKILEYSFKKQKKEYKALIDQLKSDITNKQEQIKILKDQIKNGVPPKENAQQKYTG